MNREGKPFIIYALPRSRTAWLSKFLTYRDWRCHHEAAITLREISDIPGLFGRRTGTVETAASQGHWLLEHYVPGIRQVVIRRPMEDVVRSMLAVDLKGDFRYDEARLRSIMAYGNRMLDQIAARPGVLTIEFSELETEAGCARVFEHCLPHAHNPAWWAYWAERNVQVDVRAVIQYYHANRRAIEGFKRACKRELIQLVRQQTIQRKAA